MLELFLRDGGVMTGEDSPPGQKSPRVAGAGSPIDLPVKHRAVW